MDTASYLAFHKLSEEKFSSAQLLANCGNYTDALIMLDAAVKAKIKGALTAAALPGITAENILSAYNQFLAEDGSFKNDFPFVFEHMSTLIAWSHTLAREVSRKEFLEILENVKAFLKDADTFITCQATGEGKDAEEEAKRNVMRSLMTEPFLRMSNDKLDSAVLLYDAQKYADCYLLLTAALKMRIKGLFLAALGELPDGDPGDLLKKHFYSGGNTFPKKDFTPLFRRMENVHNLSPEEKAIDKQTCLTLLDETEDFFRETTRLVKKSLPVKKSKKLFFILTGTALCSIGILIVLLTVILPLSDLQSNTGGLTGIYYKGTELSPKNILFKRIDRVINFNWSAHPPSPDMPSSQYSVRWTGGIFADAEGEYTFFTVSDDGVKLWIDSKLLIDSWVIQGETEHSGKIFLKMGWHDLRLEYFQAQGSAIIKLQWDRGLLSQNVVTSNYLRP